MRMMRGTRGITLSLPRLLRILLNVLSASPLSMEIAGMQGSVTQAVMLFLPTGQGI